MQYDGIKESSYGDKYRQYLLDGGDDAELVAAERATQLEGRQTTRRGARDVSSVAFRLGLQFGLSSDDVPAGMIYTNQLSVSLPPGSETELSSWGVYDANALACNGINLAALIKSKGVDSPEVTEEINSFNEVFLAGIPEDAIREWISTAGAREGVTQ